MTLEFEVIENPKPDSPLWKKWKFLVDSEGWTSDDNSVTELTPQLPSTRSIFAVDPSDKSFIGAVIWNEYDDICFVGFFILAQSFRGKGVGMKIFSQAVERMPKDYTLALRSVPTMVEKYKSRFCPLAGADLMNYRMSTKKFQEVFLNVPHDNPSHQLVDDLSDKDFEKLKEFDKIVTGRDRTDFLSLYYTRMNTTAHGLVIFSKDRSQITAHISAVPTSHPSDRLIKISPLYASDKRSAISALIFFSTHLHKEYPDHDVIFHLLDYENGNELAKIFKAHKVDGVLSGVSLYSKMPKEYGKFYYCWIPHNNSCHYDW